MSASSSSSSSSPPPIPSRIDGIPVTSTSNGRIDASDDVASATLTLGPVFGSSALFVLAIVLTVRWKRHRTWRGILGFPSRNAISPTESTDTVLSAVGNGKPLLCDAYILAEEDEKEKTRLLESHGVRPRWRDVKPVSATCSSTTFMPTSDDDPSRTLTACTTRTNTRMQSGSLTVSAISESATTTTTTTTRRRNPIVILNACLAHLRPSRVFAFAFAFPSFTSRLSPSSSLSPRSSSSSFSSSTPSPARSRQNSYPQSRARIRHHLHVAVLISMPSPPRPPLSPTSLLPPPVPIKEKRVSFDSECDSDEDEIEYEKAEMRRRLEIERGRGRCTADLSLALGIADVDVDVDVDLDAVDGDTTS